ncbi:hypothetical protein MBCUT_05960 [Methanobrevibacter cuticularis]|uniref:Uncharacterized protein n=1 Tax=Methanobrevibacter cuticularis TaxID=47311 RepID=A0A166EJR9_9EURY|nr:hypothetical protein [Methanobrevibacter cuticularis]KZX16732.1 hypothetical protein MBCUT_05960 [Methanobrevibacter cuticularis]
MILNSDKFKYKDNFSKEVIYEKILDLLVFVYEKIMNRRKSKPYTREYIRLKRFGPEDCYNAELKDYINKYKSHSNFSLEHILANNETQDGTTTYHEKGRNDIRITYITQAFTLNPKEYFVIECKRLDGSNTLNDNYIRKGLMKFITGTYSSNENNAIMIGYIEKGEISDIINKLNKKLNNIKNIHTLKILSPVNTVENFDYMYNSKHKRNSRLPTILIHHLMFDYKDITILN